MRDFLERRAKHLHAWVQRSDSIPCLDPAPRKRPSLESALVLLAQSRCFCAAEWRAISSVNRAHCRSVGDSQLLGPILALLLQGFSCMQGLADGANSIFVRNDTRIAAVRQRLESLTKADLVAMKQEIQSHMPTRPASCFTVLEIASRLLQPNQKHDDFAVRRLGSDFKTLERVLACGPLQAEKLHPFIRQRFSRQVALKADAIADQASRHDAVGALAEWLQVMSDTLQDNIEVRGIHQAKEAVASHIVPLAKWALRPHGKHRLFSRPTPPPAEALPRPKPASAATPRTQKKEQFAAVAPSGSRPAGPSRRCFGGMPQNALPRSCRPGSGNALPGVAASSNVDVSKAAPAVPALGGRCKIVEPITGCSSASSSCEPPARLGMGAPRALQDWFRDFGHPVQIPEESQAHFQTPGSPGLPPPTVLAAPLEKHKAWGAHSSSSSTASTDEGSPWDWASRQSTSTCASSAAMSTAPSIPCSGWPSPSPEIAKPRQQCEANVPYPQVDRPPDHVRGFDVPILDGAGAELELSSDDEDIFDMGRS